MINELKPEFTKKDLIDYVMEDIKFNVYDMEDDEFELLQDFSRYLKIIENFKVQFPKTKSVLDNIFNGIRLKANQLFMYLAIPHNNSASVIIREIAENFIILSFLMENSSKFSKIGHCGHLSKLARKVDVIPKILKQCITSGFAALKKIMNC